MIFSNSFLNTNIYVSYKKFIYCSFIEFLSILYIAASLYVRSKFVKHIYIDINTFRLWSVQHLLSMCWKLVLTQRGGSWLVGCRRYMYCISSLLLCYIELAVAPHSCICWAMRRCMTEQTMGAMVWIRTNDQCKMVERMTMCVDYERTDREMTQKYSVELTQFNWRVKTEQTMKL